VSDSAAKRALEGERTIALLGDPDIDPVDREELTDWGGRTLVILPLSVKGQTIGLVELFDAVEERILDDDALRLWQGIADQAAVAVQNARLYEQVKVSLNEKEVLLKEIHHRVKNNLQVISSLLSLQGDYAGDEASAKLFGESQDRIRAMALVHEKLYQSKDLARVDFAEYVRSLTQYLLQSHRADTSSIALEIDAEVIQLSLDAAIPCGLIVNELVSNALKHAFPAGTTGEVRVTLRSEGDTVKLSVRDNGVGLPDDLDLGYTETLGLQLVNSLVRQLDGTMTVDGKDGTECVIAFGNHSQLSGG
jgi:two-component sensor histidine kinase